MSYQVELSAVIDFTENDVAEAMDLFSGLSELDALKKMLATSLPALRESEDGIVITSLEVKATP